MTWYGGKEAGKRANSSHSGARRRALEAAAPSAGERLSLDALYARDNGWCWLCKAPVHRSDASRDHVVPLSKGGGKGADNERLAHRACNSSKGSRTSPKRKGLRRTAIKRKPRVIPPECF